LVNTVVGVHNSDVLNIVSELQKKANNADERLKAIEEKLKLISVADNTNIQQK